jgi:hypothetical protein
MLFLRAKVTTLTLIILLLTSGLVTMASNFTPLTNYECCEEEIDDITESANFINRKNRAVLKRPILVKRSISAQHLLAPITFVFLRNNFLPKQNRPILFRSLLI